MLVLVYTFNFIDRQIVGILAVPIKADLGLTDTQLGLMGGLAFALFYTLLGIPIALLADRGNRTDHRHGGAGGLERDDRRLRLRAEFLAAVPRAARRRRRRGGRRRAVATRWWPTTFRRSNGRARLAVYSFGVPIGSALGILFGGLHRHARRLAYRLHRRGRCGRAGRAASSSWSCASRSADASMRRRRTRSAPAGHRRGHAHACSASPRSGGCRSALAASSMMGYGLFFWLPSFLVRSHGLSLLEASLFFGAILLRRRHRGHLARRLAGRPVRDSAATRVRLHPGGGIRRDDTVLPVRA